MRKKINKKIGYGFFAKTKEGELKSVIEQSMSMAFSKNGVRPYFPNYSFSEKKGKDKKTVEAEYLISLNEMLENYKKRFPELRFFLVRLNSKKCPVVLNWKSYHINKSRNIPWTLKETEI